MVLANLHTYVTQEVIVPQEEEEPTEASLIDVSETSIERDSRSVDSISPAPSQSHIDIIAERDSLIKHLHSEIERVKTEFSKMIVQRNKEVDKLHEQISSLETEIATKESELIQERQIKEDLFHQATAVAQSQDSERKYVKLLN